MVDMVASKKRCPVGSDSKDDHSLLSFMKLASDKVKTALEKPNSFKRNINHRRFLQKQFKALVRTPDSFPTRKSVHPTKEKVQPVDYMSCDKRLTPSPPDTNSFLLEPMLQPDFLSLSTQESITAPFLDSSLGKIGDIRQNENSGLPETTYHQTSIPDLVVEEDVFLTGEELTQAIELKDLFIPETDLTQCSNIQNSFGLFNNEGPCGDFDSWISQDFLKDDITVF